MEMLCIVSRTVLDSRTVARCCLLEDAAILEQSEVSMCLLTSCASQGVTWACWAGDLDTKARIDVCRTVLSIGDVLPKIGCIKIERYRSDDVGVIVNIVGKCQDPVKAELHSAAARI
jgi:hypothetical protein